jgi:hypothetical protein
MISLRAKLIALIFYGCSAMAIGAYVVDSKWQSDWGSHMLADAQANQKAAEDALTRQQNLQTELEEAYATAKTMQDDHQRNLANAASAAERLRDQLSRIKGMPAVTDSSPIAERAAAATNRVVLAELLGISDRRAGEYAQYADENRLALMACRAEYGVIKKLSGG